MLSITYAFQVVGYAINLSVIICTKNFGKIGNAVSDAQHHLDNLVRWLRETFSGGSSQALDIHELQEIVRMCYEKRRSPHFEVLKSFAGLGESRRSEFEQLFKLLCKLGKHVHVAKNLVEAAVSLSQDFIGGVRIRTLTSSKEQKFPLTPKEATVESTVHRMFSTDEEQSKFMFRLQSIWDPSELSRILHNKRNTKTKVHAELLLIDHFESRQCRFLDDNDKYIGCSKPACYLCYAYIISHPGRYAIPPSHQKLYVGWRPPDINLDDTISVTRQKKEEKILLKLIERIRRDITTDIESRTPRLPYHADSTAGLTSVPKVEASPRLSAISVSDLRLDCQYRATRVHLLMRFEKLATYHGVSRAQSDFSDSPSFPDNGGGDSGNGNDDFGNNNDDNSYDDDNDDNNDDDDDDDDGGVRLD